MLVPKRTICQYYWKWHSHFQYWHPLSVLSFFGSHFRKFSIWYSTQTGNLPLGIGCDSFRTISGTGLCHFWFGHSLGPVPKLDSMRGGYARWWVCGSMATAQRTMTLTMMVMARRATMTMTMGTVRRDATTRTNVLDVGFTTKPYHTCGMAY